MKQTKIETILIFGILILYYALSQIFFVKMGSIYSIIINPLFWILLCISLKLYIKKTYAIAKLKKEIVDYTLIAVLGYIIVYLISGLTTNTFTLLLPCLANSLTVYSIESLVGLKNRVNVA